MLSKSNILKISLFATGLSGIVAEYLLSTLATYFLGNSVFQWTMILSIMLFSMGLGSRLSQYIERNILEKFIIIEFVLSILVAFCSLIAYSAKAYASFNDTLSIFPLPFDGVIIYTLSIAIGLLIGLEIPMVTRLNQEFEELKVNIANVMEKDYYGGLVGGIFFAFIGLPIFGLTYTPFILGSINFVVAIFLIYILKKNITPSYKRWFIPIAGMIFVLIVSGTAFAQRIINYGEQKNYKDRVIYQEQTPYQRIVLTEWKENYWFYLNGNLQLSSYDEWMYHEPLVHPALKLAQHPQRVLVLGGGDGCAVREILKHPSVESITLVDLDSAVTNLAKKHPAFLKMNEGALESEKLTIINADAFNYLENSNEFFDAMIIDFPDPKSIQLGRLYSLEFYRMCYDHLRPNGVIIAQAGSPYYATRAFKCIEKTMGAAGFNTIPLHNQILSLGEWGWIMGAKSVPKEQLKPILRGMKYDNIPTKWLTNEGMQLITSFGKDIVPMDTSLIRVNRINDPVLPEYYRKGNWDFFNY
ncbi:MAG: polyamine aminopropyltransferase [Flammeovirgaceae bacterium]